MRNLKKFLALTLSATMALGMSMTSMAAEPEVSVDAPIYAYDITQIVVPTNFTVAFNPNGLQVTKNGATVTDQIVSKNYGIINKSTKDKVITVTLKVEDLNEDKIQFKDAAYDMDTAPADEYAVKLTMIPADATEVQVGTTPASATLTTTGADLANATMTPATGSAKVLAAGENDVDFLLSKADYTGSIDLDSATDNNVADNFTLSGLAAAGKGITAFTFGGTMNAKADWTKLTKGIKITAVYGNENAPDGAAAVTGTGALIEYPTPVFKTGAEIGTIKYKKGTGNDAVESITSITMDYKGKATDGYATAVDTNGVITFAEAYMKYYLTAYPADAMREATVTYVTAGGETKTATVDVKLKEVIQAPSFTSSTAGVINYTRGSGSEALASITSITMDYKGRATDGYSTATDANGVITFNAAYMKYYTTEYPADTTREATVTYVTTGGETKTATVDVKLR